MEGLKDHINYFVEKHFINPPDICICGNRKITLNKFRKNKINPYCFRCTKKNCKKIYPLLEKSFFSDFNKTPLLVLMDTIRCFIDYKFNVIEAKNFLKNTRGYDISELHIRNIYTKARKYIYLYYIAEYEAETLGEINQHKFYSIDESLFSHDINCNQLWVLGCTNNSTKDFRLVLSRDRDGTTLRRFITKYIPTGNNLVTDGWHGYDWVNIPGSGYRRYTHIHGRFDFGHGLQSTSHIESIWSQVKDEITSCYKMIPSTNLLYFIREAEWKIKSKSLNYQEKLEDFFGMYNIVVIIGEEELIDQDFINNDEINFI